MKDDRPSAARRQALRQGTTAKSLVPTVPLTNYYELTDRLYASFCVALDNRKLDDAYVWGIRFATFSTEALPTHPAYGQSIFLKLRKRNAQRTQHVLTQLEAVAQRMDAEELLKGQQRQHQILQQRRAQEQEEERLRLLDVIKQKQEEEAEKERKRVELVQKQHREQEERIRLENSKIAHQQAVKHSALAKLASLQNISQQSFPEQQPHQQEQLRATSSEPETSSISTRVVGTSNSRSKCSNNESIEVATHSQANLAELVGNDQQLDPMLASNTSTTTSTFKDANDGNTSDYYNPTKELSDEEKRTLALLQQTIDRQEARIQDIVHGKIPAWRSQAKAKLATGQRKDALHCVYHKRRWQRAVDVLKESIFQMETQILRIQSAAQDREVTSVLQAATAAMQAIQKQEGVTNNAMEFMGEIGHGALLLPTISDDEMALDDVEEDELLSELLSEETIAENSSTSTTTSDPSKASSTMDFASWLPADVLDLLALPSSKAETKTTTIDSEKKKGLLKAVLG
jgi:Snf7